jgi:hypothetical protein
VTERTDELTLALVMLPEDANAGAVRIHVPADARV